MFSTLNKVTLIGKISKKPEIQQLENGGALCRFTLMTHDYFTDKKTGQKKESNDWHSIVFWGEQAKQIYPKIKENDLLYIEGKLKHRKWIAKDGTQHSSGEIFAHEYLLIAKEHSTQLSIEAIYPTENNPEKPKPLQEFNASDLDELPF
jgi:single-strand DNA-binding protein